MTTVLDGIRVLELTQWAYVPSAGAILADWGATVLKVEHPVQGDPIRGLVSSAMTPNGASSAVDFMWQIPNRGKRSIGVDLTTPGGRDLIYRLAAGCDVFLTSFLEPARKKLGLDLDDIRAHNPSIVYARGSGQGPRGPEGHKGGFDLGSFWSRGGPSASVTPDDQPYPLGMPGGGFGDYTSGMALAGGIAAALVRRERTGEGAVVDGSLLNTAMWTMSPGIVSSLLFGPSLPPPPPSPRSQPTNPLVGVYRTKDNRFVNLVFLQSDRYWPDFCRNVGRPELLDDARFAEAAARAEHREEFVAVLDELFAERTLDEWRDVLDRADGVWAPVQTVADVGHDRQALANGYLRDVVTNDGTALTLVACPVQFDETPPALTGAPELGQHTEEVLLELGLTWDEITMHKERGDII